MLPLELLKVIFGALSRNDMDALMLTNVLFRDIVLRDFAKEPFRYFAALEIHGHKDYEFVLTRKNKYLCEDNDDFRRRLRLARVRTLEFAYLDSFDKDHFELLLPFKDAWRDGNVDAPCNFASASLLERAFSELLFCKSMFVDTGVDDDANEVQLSQPCFSLPAVRECTSLEIASFPSPLTVAGILQWLYVDACPRKPKWLAVGKDELADSVENLVQKLKTDFIESTQARGYVVSTSGGAYDGLTGQFVNKLTSEVLVISVFHESFATDYVTMERKPMDEK